MTHPLRLSGAVPRTRPPVHAAPAAGSAAGPRASSVSPARPGHSPAPTPPSWEELLGRR
ncbi:MAG: hypothetical protein ACKOZT_08390 [Cyanobium sp.]